MNTKKLLTATVLGTSLAFSSLLSATNEITMVQAASKLPDNHTIEQLEVKWRKDLNNGYLIHTGNRKGTLLIRVDQPKIERDIEWVNWGISKPSAVNFELGKDISSENYSNDSNRITYFDALDSIDMFGYKKGTGYMKFSDFNDKNYYAGLAIYIPQKLNADGIYRFGGRGSALPEDGQVKAYFFPDVDVVEESMKRVKKDGTFPLMNKVMWGKTELWKGQLGKVTIQKPTILWKRTSSGLYTKVRDMKVGDEHRVYRYLSEKNGLYGVGADMYVEKNTDKVLYETPSKRNLRLVKITHGEE